MKHFLIYTNKHKDKNLTMTERIRSYLETRGQRVSLKIKEAAWKEQPEADDEEAADILLDYIDRNYYDSDLDETEFFANSFEDAGERIMQVTKSPWIPILSICAVAAVLAIVAVLFQQKRKAEAAKAKELEDMLSKPLETFDDKEAEDLAKKYENAEDPVSRYAET